MTEQRARELLPCPFCGKDDSDDNAVQEAAVVLRSFKAASGGRAHRVECACGTFGPSHRFAEEAIAAWNTRATPFAESAKSPSDSVREALTVEAYNDLYDPADEAGQETFSNGFREGFLYARYPEGYDQEDAALALAEIEDIAMGEAWGGYRDDFFRRLPIAAIPDQSEIGKPIARAALQSSEDQGNG